MPSIAQTVSQITLNGVARPLGGIHSISDLVVAHGLDPRAVAIELNGAIVPRSAYRATPIASGDAVEIVGFIGGG